MNKKKIRVSSILLNLLCIVLCAVIAAPLLWIILNSFKTNQEMFMDSLALPEVWQFGNYAKAWSMGLYRYFGNSVLVSAIALVGILVLASFLAYGLTRFRAKGSNIIFIIVLGGMALSEQIALVPLYNILQALHLYDTYAAVILPYIAFRIPFTVFLMRAYFITIPEELEEAAVVDGYNSLQIFTKIIVPISKPIFASCAIVNLNFVWNEFLFANVFLSNKAIQTIPIGLMTFKGDLKVDYTTTLAGLIIASMPLIILFLLMSKQFVRGLTSGAVKG
ncbi:MAG TPA: carbohydrate ABC transporter permease [Candidatus Enterocloster excrementipullorum]|uniref:Carbohydrate ABC transporter permease n=1 Tax=Candidatus Enterocloster excrementipullorum TaxID=2838559 RepID=A0A9D2MZ01_9FIRM|nr:carbohydrate ABC transporter permease [Candidatus Enterocloster excrementipullorum]